jgi:hypothetical protein
MGGRGGEGHGKAGVGLMHTWWVWSERVTGVLPACIHIRGDGVGAEGTEREGQKGKKQYQGLLLLILQTNNATKACFSARSHERAVHICTNQDRGRTRGRKEKKWGSRIVTERGKKETESKPMPDGDKTANRKKTYMGRKPRKRVDLHYFYTRMSGCHVMFSLALRLCLGLVLLPALQNVQHKVVDLLRTPLPLLTNGLLPPRRHRVLLLRRLRSRGWRS